MSQGEVLSYYPARLTELQFTADFEYEHMCCDPKDSELYMGRVKSRETLMEARTGTDVQIVLKTCV